MKKTLYGCISVLETLLDLLGALNHYPKLSALTPSHVRGLVMSEGLTDTVWGFGEGKKTTAHMSIHLVPLKNT